MSDMISAEEAQEMLDGTTKGPWTVETGNVPIADTGDYDGYCRLMAGGRIIFEQWGDDEQSEKDANLAGAAPDLARTVIALHAQLADAKAALEGVLGAMLLSSNFSFDTLTRNASEAGYAALAKARGSAVGDAQAAIRAEAAAIRGDTE